MPSGKQPPNEPLRRGSRVTWSERTGNDVTGLAAAVSSVEQRTAAAAPRSGPPETASLRAGVTETTAGRWWRGNGLTEEEPLEPEPSADFLQGELSRLETTLNDRDDKIGMLNRELGGMERRLQELETAEQAPPTGSRAWLGRLGKGIARMLGREAEAGDGAETQTVFWDELKRRGPLVPFARVNTGKRIIAFTVFGLPRERLEKVLDTVEKYCRKRDTVPVILTDSDCFDVFRERNLAFEYLPPPETRERFGPDLQWPLYFRRRLMVFRSKWRPAGMVSFGSRGPIKDAERLLTADPENPERGNGDTA